MDLIAADEDLRKKVLGAVLGSRQSRQALNHYRDNDVTTSKGHILGLEEAVLGRRIVHTTSASCFQRLRSCSESKLMYF